METKKCVIVGDEDVGKTCLVIRYSNNEFHSQHVPTVLDVYPKKVSVDGQAYNFTFHDTSGQEDYDRLRPTSYTESNVFLLCFSVINPSTFNNIKEKWCPEVRHYCPQIPVVLVGTKIDLRKDRATLDKLATRELRPISTADGIQLGLDINAVKYLECSAFTMEGLLEVFNEAIYLAVKPPEVKINGKYDCVIS